MKLEIMDGQNGYIVKVIGGVKREGFYIFRLIDVIKMIEFIGEVLIDKRIEVTEK